jgi:signal transduction histidine kinase
VQASRTRCRLDEGNELITKRPTDKRSASDDDLRRRGRTAIEDAPRSLASGRTAADAALSETRADHIRSDALDAGPIRQRLLIVEDNPGDARLLRQMFTEHGSRPTEVIHVERMSAAEEHLAANTVDAILLDLGLPDAEGLEAVRRAHAAAPGVPLLVLTGLDDESLAVKSLQEGAQDYLIKGQIDARGLARALRYAIERKTLEDARKAAENQLLQAQKLESIGRLAGGIAHDFNNMLFAIHGYAELMTQDLAANAPDLDRAQLMQSVTAIRDAAERATALTGQLLSFSRQHAVSVHVLDVNAAVATIEPMVRQLIGKQMRLVVKLDAGAGHIRADMGQIDQILVNLVVNARDAMPSGGTVTIETGNAVFDDHAPGNGAIGAGSYVFLAVTDTGIGMDQATRDLMFEPFFTTKATGKGTGLGLATTNGIVNRAGGHIEVESEPGRGSAFRLYFPRIDAAVDAEPDDPDARIVGAGRILVVEDEPAVRDMIAQVLERAGYAVVSVADAAEAVATAKLLQPFDALVTDVVMPNLSGIELVDELMNEYPLLGVVLVSGYTADTLDLEQVVARGARFLAKPVTSNRLLATVIDAIAARRTAEAVVPASG